jgi:hypothetical protein
MTERPDFRIFWGGVYHASFLFNRETGTFLIVGAFLIGIGRSAAWFAVYEGCKRFLTSLSGDQTKLSPVAVMTAGGFAGASRGSQTHMMLQQ